MFAFWNTRRIPPLLLMGLLGGCDVALSTADPAFMDDSERREAQAEDAEVRPENLVERLEEIDLLDSAFVTRVRLEKEQWIPVLESAVEGGRLSSRALMNAGFLLLEVGESRGTDALIEALRGQDRPFWIGVFTRLHFSASALEKLPLDTARFAPVLLACLDDPASRLGDAALELSGSYQITQTFSRLRELLSHRDLGVRAKSCSFLLVAGEHEARVLDCAERLLEDDRFVAMRNGSRAQSLLQQGLAVAAAGADAAARERTLAMLERFVRASLSSESYAVVHPLQRSIATIANEGGTAAIPFLESVFASRTHRMVRGTTLIHLADLQGPKCLPAVLEGLRDAQLETSAAKALLILVRKHEVRPPVEDLVAIVRDGTHVEGFLSTIVQVLLAMEEPEATAAAKSLIERLDPVDRMDIHWRVKEITPRDALARLVEEGIVPELPASAVDELVAGWEKRPSAWGFVTGACFAARTLVFFDGEAGTIPVEHGRLVSRFGAATRGIFEPQAVVQKWNQTTRRELDADYAVEFVLAGETHRFKARYLGDWYDVEAVVRAVNGALEKAGRTQRFLRLHGGGQVEFIIFADAEAFERVREELMIPLHSSGADK